MGAAACWAATTPQTDAVLSKENLMRIYAVPYTGTITNAGGDTDLFSFAPADDKAIRLRGFRLSQISEVGDAAEEGLRIAVRRMTATWTVGSGGSAITALAPLGESTGTVWGFTARGNDTTISTTSGTNQVCDEMGWNIRNSPYEWIYPDVDFCPVAKQGEAIVICQHTTAADDYTGHFTAWVEEI